MIMTMTPSRKALFSHIAVYLAVNAILLVINASQTPEEGEAREWWALWPLAGWGIAVATHAFAEWAQTNSGKGHLLADPDIRGLAVHAFVYLAVNALLIGINLSGSSESLWFVWPLLGWGLGLAAHAALAYRAASKRKVEGAKPKSASRNARKSSRRATAAKKPSPRKGAKRSAPKTV